MAGNARFNAKFGQWKGPVTILKTFNTKMLCDKLYQDPGYHNLGLKIGKWFSEPQIQLLS